MRSLALAQLGGVAVVAVVATLTLSGCSSDAGQGSIQGGDRTETSPSTPSDAPSAVPSATAPIDTSVVDALHEAGVPDRLVDELGRVADATGYGLSPGNSLDLQQRQSFAAIQITTCREVAAGNKSWAEVKSSDVAGGAPAASATEMVRFLQESFCPAVGPVE